MSTVPDADSPSLRVFGIAGTTGGASVRVVRGISSEVLIDSERGEVHKIYRPRWWVQALYWLAFQARFPYDWRRDALEAAREKRAVAGALTRYWFGDNHVAQITGVREGQGRLALTSEFIGGGPPKTPRHARGWLRELSGRFADAGLPTWQIAPYNPHALSNVIETPDGRFIVVDLESTLVIPFGMIRGALRRGAYPVFDDIDFNRLRHYLVRHRDALASSLGTQAFEGLREAVDRLERADRSWRQDEPRLLGRFVARLVRSRDDRRFSHVSPDHQG